jgi:SAM-dependent methyltransferase
MKQAVTEIKKYYPTINGAVFSGLVFEVENSVAKTTETEFLEILKLKTDGSINFYQAFQAEPLDFMCWFSSAQAFSFSGAANFSAYAAGITFADTWVHSRREKAPFPVGIINWGFWKSSTEIKTLSRNIGVLEDREGFACFEQFTDLLQKGLVTQVVCFRASASVKELMNRKDDQLIAIADQSSVSMIRTLGDDLKTPEHQKVQQQIGDSKQAAFEAGMAKLLFRQMQQLGICHAGEAPVEIAVLQQRAGVVPKYTRWFREALDILAEKDYLQCRDGQAGGSRNKQPEDGAKVRRDWELFRESCFGEPHWKAQVDLIEVCMEKLQEILRGKIRAVDVVFPDSSPKMVEGLYKDNLAAKYFNTVVAELAAAYTGKRLAAGGRVPVKIIEIGAGTGGTSIPVLAKLKPWGDQLEYCYTDISKSFLMEAAELLGPEYPCLRFKAWDVEKPPEAQGIDAGGYDLAIATNVLHAVKDIRQTLRHVKAALKANGILLLNEGSRKTSFTSLTFGLLDGWWQYEDEPLRIPGSPLLAPENWRRVLEEEGFREVSFPAEAAGDLGQQVMIAESDGCIRRKVAGARVSLKGPESRKQVAVSRDGITGQNPEEYLKTLLIDHLSQSLKIATESIGCNTAFSDYGFDSILAVDFVKQVNRKLGLEMNSAILFDYPTVDRLAGYIVTNYLEAIRKKMAGDLAIERDDEAVKKDEQFWRDLENRFLEDEISVESLIAALKK